VARYDTASDIINQVAAEVGLTPVADPYVVTDPAFSQLRYLLNSAGQELVFFNAWQKLIKTHTITTVVPGDTGDYVLPDDFAYIIDQTGWSPTNRLPLGGPLTPQDWTYLVNTNLAQTTIYVSFRQSQGLFRVLPQPPPNGVVINFEYISRYWVAVTGSVEPAKDSCTLTSDVILLEPILIKKFLKLRFLEAKGFDTSAASDQFNAAFLTVTGKDVAAPILSMARNRTFPYLDWRNIPETNFGVP
jgi:hypothetical protein